MKKEKISTDRYVVEEAISWLNEYKNKLEDVEEINEYNDGVNTALSCINGSIDTRIDYFEEVLTWYDDNEHCCGTFEVIDMFEGLIWVLLETAKEQENTHFGKGMADTCNQHLFMFANKLESIDPEENDKVLETYLYLSKKGMTIAMIGAGIRYQNREQYKKAKRMFEKAAKQGSRSAAEHLMEMVDYGYISESDLKSDYGIEKLNCVICGNEIHDIDYVPCKICGWAHTTADFYEKDWEKDAFNLMSRKKAKRLYERGLTNFGKPLPYFKEKK